MIRHSRKRDHRGPGPGGEKGRGLCGQFHLLGGTWDARGWGAGSPGQGPWGAGSVRPPARVSVCLAKRLRLNSKGNSP